MTLSARQILERAGVDLTEEAWATLQIAKVHTDLAYRLETVEDHAIVTFAQERQVRIEFWQGPIALRQARARINRIKRGEETL